MPDFGDGFEDGAALEGLHPALFASARPVLRRALTRLVEEGESVDLLVANLRAEIADRFCKGVAVVEVFVLPTRMTNAPAIRAIADLGNASPESRPWDVAVLDAIAYRQPTNRDDVARHLDHQSLRYLPDKERPGLDKEG